MGKVRIFQGYFDEDSRRGLDPAAESVDISFNLNHPLYEYNAFKTLLANGTMDPSGGPVGLLSWKFTTKTLMSVSEFRVFCEKAFAVGADVAFVNPMIAAEAMYSNVWQQGEHVGHTNMMKMAEGLLSGQQVKQAALMPKSAFAFCNYFVGNDRFWQKYTAFCDAILSKIETLKAANPGAYAMICASANYNGNMMADFRPFILERMFSTFLMLHPDIKRVTFEYSPEAYEKKFGESVGRYLYLLSGLKNNAIHSASQERLDKWNEMRQPLLKNPKEIWEKDNPAPEQPAANPETQVEAEFSGPVVTMKNLELFLSGQEGEGRQGALRAIMNIASDLSVHRALRGYVLFIPQLDDILARAAARLAPAASQQAGGPIVHVATEIYETGGHTRVIEDIVRALPEYRHVVIVTDVFDTYRNGQQSLGLLEQRFASMNIEIIFVMEKSLPLKVQELAAALVRLAPSAIFHFAHHFDVVASAAISGASAPRVIYVHHCDHNPALGATRRDYIHLDLSPPCFDVCKAMAVTAPRFLGLSVEDNGVAEPVERDAFIGVTCGSAHKYVGKCGFTYTELLAALFAGGVAKIIHIGEMPEDLQVTMKAEIARLGQDPGRLVFHGNTPSLAGILKDIAPDFFLCSYPVGGGKAMIEAMSVGLPIINPHAPVTPPLICADMSLGVALTVRWLDEVPSLLQRLRTEKKELGRRNREMFEAHYALSSFRQKLRDILANG